MGNKVDTSVIDVVYPMSIQQRVNRLVVGYLRTDHKHLPAEIVAICIGYAAIDKHNDYHLIKSHTELKEDAESRQRLHIDNITNIDDWTGNTVKICVLGAGRVGRTSLCVLFAHNILYMFDEHDPWPADNTYFKYTEVDGRDVLFEIVDADLEQYPSQTYQYMAEAHCFIIVYSIACRATFEVALILIEKVRRCKGEDKPWFGVVAGNKADLKDMRTVPTEEWKYVAAEHANLKFMETSVNQNMNQEVAFLECARWLFYVQEMCTAPRSRTLTDSDKDCECAIL